MFFCEECKQKNRWPGIIAFSYGTCEMCGDKAACYDVPPGQLPAPQPKKHNDAVHKAHCCQLHGCKYGQKDCPVVHKGWQEGMCEVCYDELYNEGGWEDAHFANEMYNKGRESARLFKGLGK